METLSNWGRASTGQLAEVAGLLDQPHPGPLMRRLLGVASQLARRDLEDGNPRLAHDMLAHARRSLRDLPGDMSALLYTTDAWTCAALGEYRQMSRCLDEAACTAGDADSLFGAAELAGIAGACYEILASRVPRPQRSGHITQAEDRITEALRIRNPLYARSRALDLAGLANVRLVQGEPDEAMRTASEALDLAAGLRSDRVARRVHALAIRALDMYPAVPAVTEFSEVVRSQLPVAPPTEKPGSSQWSGRSTEHGPSTAARGSAWTSSTSSSPTGNGTSSTSPGWPGPSPRPS
jgi:hypothetical protein